MVNREESRTFHVLYLLFWLSQWSSKIFHQSQRGLLMREKGPCTVTFHVMRSNGVPLEDVLISIEMKHPPDKLRHASIHPYRRGRNCAFYGSAKTASSF